MTPMNGQFEIRKILKFALCKAQIKNSSYSLRSFAKKLNLSPSELSEMIKGKRRISNPKGKIILEKLNTAPEQIKTILSNLQIKQSELRKLKSSASEKFNQLSMEHFDVISDWYHFAILSLAETNDFKPCPSWISKRLNISTNEASEALERLIKLKLLIKKNNNKLVTSGEQLSTPADILNISIQKNHSQCLELATKALRRPQLEKRDFSGITMAIDPGKLPEAKKMIREFRRSLCDFLESGEKKEIYRMCIQLFSLSQ